jgi:serine/threonine protein kinase/TolB-like protein/Flp pilus assembly protein TadD
MMPNRKQSLGPYELLAPIGAGGMGEVFRARDTRLNREVAIKVLPKEFATDPDRLRRFEQETKTLAALNHPNILTLYDAGIQDGAPFLVSELLEGKTLREEVRAGALPLRRATDYALQTAQGLAAAHAGGVIHRDLKPENIFITKDGRVKVLDFGLAKLRLVGTRSTASPTENLEAGVEPAPTISIGATAIINSTQPGVVMGTPAYMSPEQVRGEPTDHRSDIFAFGCVLYEMLNGTSAFRRDTPVESMHAVLKEEPSALTGTNPQFPPALERIVRRCLEKQPENRFQSANDLAFALSEVSTSGLTPAREPHETEKSGWTVNLKVLLSVAAAIVLAGLAVWQPWRKPPRSTSSTLREPPVTANGSEPGRTALQRARQVQIKGLDASLDELKLAITLCQSEVERNPADAETWALLCRLHCNDYYNFDRTPARLKAAQAAAGNALSLAPKLISARVAQASVYSLEPTTFGQGLEMLRQLEREAPQDPDVLLALAWVVLLGPDNAGTEGGPAEALKLYDRALKLRPDDAMALSGRAWALVYLGKREEADAAWDECLRRTASPWALVGKFVDLAEIRKQPEEAKALLAKFPPDLVFNGVVVRYVTQFWLTQHEPQKALAFIQPFPGEFLVDRFADIPKGFLVGKAYAQAGQTAAARLQWRQALNAVDGKLATQPENAHMIAHKARLHFLLGDADEAARQLELYEQLTSSRLSQNSIMERFNLRLELGRVKEAVALIEENRHILTPTRADLIDLRWGLQRALAFLPELGSAPEFRDELAKIEAEVQQGESGPPAFNEGRGAALTSSNSVAVLPFANLSPDKADEYLSDGITEELLNALLRVEGLRVPGRSSSFAFKGKAEQALFRKVGEQLHVGAVLEGSVRKAGNQLRVTARLVKVADGFPIWSETYDRDMTNMFAMQSDIATRVAGSLKLKLLGAAARVKNPTENIEAYQLYLRARQLWNRREPVAAAEAIALFNQAIAADPAFALAYSGLADCYAASPLTNLTTSEAASKGRAAALKAIELDGTLGEPHAALAKFQAFNDWDWTGAEAEFRRAIELNPNYATAHHWLGINYEAQGRCAEAVAELQRARGLDPLSSIINSRAGLTLCRCGSVESGTQLLQHHLALEPTWVRAHTSLALCYFKQGRLPEAAGELEAASRLTGQPEAELGFLYARAGRTNEALEVERQIGQLTRGGQPDNTGLALVEHGLGNDAKALDLLDKAFEARESALLWLAMDGYWQDLRQHPRAQAILRKMNLVKLSAK